jgi:hypothetical protein
MAKPSKPSKPAAKAAPKIVAKAAPQVAARTEVRNTPIPKAAPAAAKKEITRDAIALRAYFISQSGTGGSEFENWVRAERELRGQ